MKCLKYKRSFIVQVVLWAMISVFGFFQIQNSYADRLNNKACRIDSFYISKNYLEQAIRINPNNPLYYANLGLLYAQSDSSLSISNFISGFIIESAALDSAITYFEQSVSIGNNESMFMLNLGLLYALKGEYIKALTYINDSQSSSDIYLLSFGILQEHVNNREVAKDLYVNALYQYPGLLDSHFYSDLKLRDSLLAEFVLCETEKLLTEEYLFSEDPIIAAKLGKIKLYLQKIDEAEILLNKATSELPSLNRPWLYLGNISELRGDTITAIEYYKKAEVLDFSDILPLFYLSRYDKRSAEKIELMREHLVTTQSFILQSKYNILLVKPKFVIRDYMKLNFIMEDSEKP